MEYKFRNNANIGTWCSLLLPLCLFPFMMKFGSGIYILLFNICLCTLLVPTIQEHKINNRSWLGENGYIVMLSLPPSLFIWHFFSYNLLLTYALCLFGILYYSHIIKNLLVKCPGSFTYGEAQVVSQGVMLFTLYSIVTLLSKVAESYNFSLIEAVPESVICLQILVLGCILLVHTLCLIPSLRQGTHFVFCCITFSGLMMSAWYVTLKKNVFIWMWLYCLNDKKRVFLILFWLLSTFSSVTFVVWINWKPNYKASTVVRKCFHFIICIVYIPGILYDVDLLRLASGIALTAFIVLEMFRILNVPIIGSAIQSAFEVFLDEKDSGILILTNIYLLVGCSCPIWLTGYISDVKGMIFLVQKNVCVNFILAYVYP
ncbi:unnamed protein product [Larinioides sclopetarius]|uniref:dolichol kinase n=1 Tax=Larinioides sclopetarius TaxID=280406 RepID=A0AAV1Z1K3_9ARAC